MSYDDLSIDFGTGLSMFPSKDGVEFRMRSYRPAENGSPSERSELCAMAAWTVEEADLLIERLILWKQLKRSQ
jgi:hypothetical protein